MKTSKMHHVRMQNQPFSLAGAAFEKYEPGQLLELSLSFDLLGIG